jgi:hypothetical protein
MDELPKTAVGKIFKPDLRRRAIERVFNAELDAHRIKAHVSEVLEDKINGLTAVVSAPSELDNKVIGEALNQFTVPWKRV